MFTTTVIFLLVVNKSSALPIKIHIKWQMLNNISQNYILVKVI